MRFKPVVFQEPYKDRIKLQGRRRGRQIAYWAETTTKRHFKEIYDHSASGHSIFGPHFKYALIARHNRVLADPRHPAQKHERGESAESAAKCSRLATTAAGPSNRPEPSPYMVLRAQQLLTQLMPTFVGDQVQVAAEALNQLQTLSQGLWGHPIQLVRDSGTDSGHSAAATVPWFPPQPPPAGERHEGANLWRRAGAQTTGDAPPSLTDDDMPGT